MRGDGRIYQRGEVFFIAYNVNGRECRESSRSTSWADAQRLLDQRLQERAALQAPLAATSSDVTYDTLADLYLADYRLHEYRTFSTARARVEHLRRSFGGLSVTAINVLRIKRYQTTRREEGVSAATVNRETTGLQRMFRLAVDSGLVKEIPAFPQRLRENPPRQGFFEVTEYEAVRRHLPPPYQDVLDFAYLSGWRRREITELTWPEVDWSGKVIRLDPARSKTASGRILPLMPEMLKILERRKQSRVPGRTLVFDRDTLTVREWKNAWPKACEAAGLKGRYLHDCRRTVARNLVRAGVSERIAMTLIGHKTRSMFDRYNIVSERDLHQASEQLGHYLAGQRR